MGFHNVILPNKFLRYGTGSGPRHMTSVPISADSGIEGRFPRWFNARQEIKASADNLTRVEAAEFLAFVVARQGATHSFLVEDPTDHSTAADHIGAPARTDSLITPPKGANASELTFQMQKRYGDSTTGFVRTITRIKPGTVLVEKNGSTTLAEGTDFVVDNHLGHIVVPAGNAGVLTAGCEFYLKVRFAINTDKFAACVLDDFDIVSTAFGLVEDQTEEVQTINGIERDIDRVFCQDERVSLGGGKDLNSLAYPASTGWPGSWADGRHISITPIKNHQYFNLPNITGQVASGEIIPGGPYLAITNMSPDNAFDRKVIVAREYTDTAGTVVRPIYTRPKIRYQRTREFFIDSGGLWRGV